MLLYLTVINISDKMVYYICYSKFDFLLCPRTPMTTYTKESYGVASLTTVRFTKRPQKAICPEFYLLLHFGWIIARNSASRDLHRSIYHHPKIEGKSLRPKD